MTMMEMTKKMEICKHLYESNDTMWLRARQFSFASEAIIQPTLFSIGIITNTLSLIVLPRVRMNRVFRICLIALAVSDLCTTIVGLVQILVEIIFYCGEVPEGHLLTPVIVNNSLYMVFLMFMSTSACVVVFIAFIRNMMYLKPMRSRAFFTSRRILIACGLIFLVTAIFWSPTCLQVIWLGCYKESNEPYCTFINESIPNLKKIANTYLYFNVALYGPIMLLAYIANFVCIRVTLKRSADAISRMTGGAAEGNRRSSTVARITKTLSMILILDVICTLPSIVQSLGLVFNPDSNHLFEKNLYNEVLDTVAEIFLAFRPTYNFWIYVFQRPEFRKRLNYLFIKVGQPCCKHSWCVCAEYCDDVNIIKQSSSDGTGTKSKNPAAINGTTLPSRLTPPLKHLKVVDNQSILKHCDA